MLRLRELNESIRDHILRIDVGAHFGEGIRVEMILKAGQRHERQVLWDPFAGFPTDALIVGIAMKVSTMRKRAGL